MGYVSLSLSRISRNSFLTPLIFEVERACRQYFKDSMSNLTANYFSCLKKSRRTASFKPQSVGVEHYEASILPLSESIFCLYVKSGFPGIWILNVRISDIYCFIVFELPFMGKKLCSFFQWHFYDGSPILFGALKKYQLNATQ